MNKNCPDKIMLRERGFTMIEMMVALTLSLVLLGAITYVVVNSNKSYNTTDSLARLQENARFAMEFITRDLRRAGYMGCSTDVDDIKSTLNGTAHGGGNVVGGASFTSFEGADDIATGALWHPSGTAVSFTNAPISGSDAITARYLDLNNPISIQKEMPNESAVLFVNSGHGLAAGDIITVTDCDGADIMQLTNVNPGSGADAGKDGLVHNSGSVSGISPGNSTQKLGRSYGPGAKVLRFLQFSYYVGTNANNRRALFRVTPTGTEELVEGVENLQILYGEATGSDRTPTKYSNASNVDLKWENVVSIRIGMLLSTVANTADGQYGTDVDSGTFQVNGTDVTLPSERRMRKVFVSTILLRNLR